MSTRPGILPALSSFILGLSAVFSAAQPPAPASPPPQRRMDYPARPPGDPAEIERGKALDGVNCQFCHGADTRGGDGGPSLLRSSTVLADQRGELIAPVLRAGRPGMPKFTFTDAQMADIAAFLHTFRAAGYDESRLKPPSIVVVGGEGTGDVVVGGATTIKGAILAVNNVLYITAPDNVWALDAHDGREIWHYFWKTKGGTHIGNRGVAMWGNYLYFVTPDDYFISLDARTGKERWHKEIAPFSQQYFLTSAPMAIGNHIIVGTGNDLDSPGYLMSFDPETGDEQWRFYTVPMKHGDPGLETWKSLDAARHGGGHPWLAGIYDPESKLHIFGTGNPTPAYTSQPRGEGLDNLFTCSIVALNVDTGKMEWYYQTSPHDTHDWGSAQTPVLVDGEFRGGSPRKMVLTASRNGYYFTLDRGTGEHMVTSMFSDTVNWAKPSLNAKGQPVREPAKDHHVAGSLVSSANGGATKWPPPAYSPDTGLLYVPVAETYAMYYLTETDPRGAMGLGGEDEVSLGSMGSYISAIDYKTGKTVWKRRFRATGNTRGAPGLLTTAGKLLFGGDVSGNFIAFDPANGNPLWHSRIGQVTNAPETYMVDGRQHILVAAGDTLYSFALYQ